MTIIDRYIARGFLVYFFSALIVFAALFSLVELIHRSVKFGVTLTLVKYTLYLLPYTISLVTPVACLIGSLAILNTLAKNSEIIAMHASGISLFRIATPILLFSLIIGCTSFILTDWVVPPTLRKARLILTRDLKGNERYDIFKTEKLWYRAKKSLYNIEYFNPDENALMDINIYLFNDDFQLTEQILAKLASYENGIWTLHDGVSITFLDDFPVSHAFKTKQADYIKENPEDLKEISKLETMNYNQLRHYIRRHKKAGFSTARHEVNLHAKFAFALACVIMAFLSIPFAVKNPRKGRAALSSGLALGIAFLYWICLNAGLSFGYSGTLPPFIAAWIANVAFALGGLYLLTKDQNMRFRWLS